MAVHGELHVAHLLGGVGGLGEARLEREDPLGRVARGVIAVAEVPELSGDVVTVGVAHLLRGVVVADVVVALG